MRRIKQEGTDISRRSESSGLFRRRLLLLAMGCVWAFALSAPAAPAIAQPPARASTVILISLDGTRPADVTPADLPTVAAFRTLGASAEYMLTANPSNTFPSHVTLATGVAPERHGLVNNSFVDPERGSFSKDAIPSWIEVEPIWSWLEGQGVVSASYHWVGSEGPWPPSGRGALYWKPFSSRTSERTKVEQILAWFDLEDESTRPRLITSWFHGADHAGHADGAGTEAVQQSLRKQDKDIAKLVAGLEARGAFETTTLVFVSDHGMVGAERFVNLGSVLKQAGVRARVLGIGGFATVVLPKDLAGPAREEQAARAVAVARAAGLEAYARGQAPAEWRVDHARFGDVVVRAPVGIAITHPGLSIDGFHGYDPTHPSMHAILLARGRGARPGSSLGVVHAVDVAPTILQLLGLSPPEWMQGRVIEGLRVQDVPSSAGWGRLDPLGQADPAPGPPSSAASVQPMPATR